MQRKRFEAEALERQVAQMAEIDRRKDEFLAILAHELRNPLQPLQTAVEIMASTTPTQPVPERVRGIIQRQVHHIGRLVDDLLDVARFQTGKLELRRETVPLDAIVDEAVDDVRAAGRRRASTRSSVTGVDAAADRLRRSDAPRPGAVESAVERDQVHRARRRDRRRLGHRTTTSAFIRVTDNGRGIPPTLLPRIFDMFVQERTTPDGKGGLGLGLGLVKRLVELHGGTVRASSDGTGKGATFEVRAAARRQPTRSRSTAAAHGHEPARAAAARGRLRRRRRSARARRRSAAHEGPRGHRRRGRPVGRVA